MELTPVQSVKIFGWWDQPRLTQAWEDIKTNNLSWRQLRELGLQPHQLQRVQPDKMQWIQRGGLCYRLQPRDILDMTVFTVNPLTDFRVDLAELWNLQYSPEQLLEMNVTFAQLLERGFNAQIMFYLNFNLSQWVKLGLAAGDVKAFSAEECEAIFGMTPDEVSGIIADYAVAHQV